MLEISPPVTVPVEVTVVPGPPPPVITVVIVYMFGFAVSIPTDALVKLSGVRLNACSAAWLALSRSAVNAMIGVNRSDNRNIPT